MSAPDPEAAFYDIDATIGDKREFYLSMDDDAWMRKVEAGRRYLDGLVRLSAQNWTQWLADIRRTALVCGAREIYPLVSAAIWRIDNIFLRRKIQDVLTSARPSFLELCSAASLVFSTPSSVEAAMKAISRLKQAEDETLLSYVDRFELLYLSVGSFRLDRY